MKKSTLPVSRKFYNELSGRITSASNAAGIDSTLLLATVCDYIVSGLIPDSDTDPLLQLAFALLRPEIDKAKERSRRARQRRLIEQAIKRSARKSVKRPGRNNAGLPSEGIRRGYKENDSIVA